MKRIQVEICQGTSCHLLGSQELTDAVNSMGQSIRDRIDLRRVDCLKSCRKGPAVRIDDVVFTAMTPELLQLLLEEKLCGEAV